MKNQCAFEIGQLVEYKTYYEGEGSWISIENQVGVVLEIIKISNEVAVSVFNEQCNVLYDIRVYWLDDGITETVPDILLCDYGEDIAL